MFKVGAGLGGLGVALGLATAFAFTADAAPPETPTTADEDREQALSDLNMLSGPGGLERTKAQYCELLDRSGGGLRGARVDGKRKDRRRGGKHDGTLHMRPFLRTMRLRWNSS